MAVAFDAKAAPNLNGTHFSQTSPASEIGKITVGSGSNRALIVLLAFNGTSVPPGLALNWDQGGTPQPMTRIGTSVNTTAAILVAFGLVAPTSGAKTLQTSWTGGGSFECAIYMISFTGVDQTGGTTSFQAFTNTGSSATSSTGTITSGASDAMCAIHCDNNTAPSISSMSDTAMDSALMFSGANFDSGGNYAVNVGNHALTSTWGASISWAAFGVNVTAAGGAAASIPFINYDWPNPVPIPQIDRTWTWSQTHMLGQDQLPNRQQDWPLPQPIPQIDRTWVWRQTGMFGQDKLPFRQQDWPNPPPVPYPDETWIWRQVQMLGKDVLPFRQQDWPNPAPIPQIDPTWLQGFILPLRSIVVVFPHNQFDWPNPAPIPQIDSTWTQGFNLFRQPVTPVKIVSVAEPTPFGAFRTFGRFGSS